MARNNFRDFIDKLPKPLKNKFVVVTAVFVVWMFFFDKHSVITQYNLNSTLLELQNKEVYFEGEIATDTEKQEELTTNDKSQEKFAREEHLMKKDDEDIFVISFKEK